MIYGRLAPSGSFLYFCIEASYVKLKPNFNSITKISFQKAIEELPVSAWVKELGKGKSIRATHKVTIEEGILFKPLIP